ncbi:cytochrome c oxidase accessory protein CcoG [Reichenbachiella sp. MALMAid0571]|uniref:cytochrome c oxidase accessory protein CcoG n=1 Tax=Reichenbachiella sp. MALMAid0571 TaxID=3143939 RepID=UPI0032DE4456
MEDFYSYDEEFRDTISTVDEEGKRIWVYPKKPKGSFHNARLLVTIVLLGLLFTGPFLTWKGNPMFLFNIFERKFILFGMPFWPQDFIILGIAMITFFVFIILFTVVFGRIWCGWACPQTLFMEMVFRKIEYWIEGDANQQRKLNQAPWNKEKILKKGSKQLIFVLISILISHTLMAYLIGKDQVIEIISQPPTAHMSGFIGLVFFTGIFYWVFSVFREQACTVVCPYGRLQGVLLDKQSIVVAYDWLRGEPRGKLKKGEPKEDKGDCIDCKLCVHVCPTGIDIRHGTQLECVNCTACIDACDEVMTKIDKPKGLIRYDSYAGIKEKKKLRLNARILAYSLVLLGLLSLLTYLIASRSDVDVTIFRVPGMLYQEQENNRISNLYNIQFVNKTYEDISLDIKLKDIPDGVIKRVGDEGISVLATESSEGTFFVELPKEYLTSRKTPIIIEVYKNGKVFDEMKTNFLGPFTTTK